MSDLPPELLLFIGGGVITVVLATIVITLLVRANREHDREMRRIGDERADSDGARDLKDDEPLA